MTKPVGQRRGKLPPISGPIRRIRSGKHPHPRRQRQITNNTIQRHRQQRSLDRRRAGTQLIQQHITSRSIGEPNSPRRRRQHHRPITSNHRQASNISRFPNRPQHNLARQPLRCRQPPHQRRLTKAGIAPKKNGHARGTAGINHSHSRGKVTHVYFSVSLGFSPTVSELTPPNDTPPRVARRHPIHVEGGVRRGQKMRLSGDLENRTSGHATDCAAPRSVSHGRAPADLVRRDLRGGKDARATSDAAVCWIA